MAINHIGSAVGHQPGRPAASSPDGSNPSVWGVSPTAIPPARARYFGPSISCVAIDYTSLIPTSWPRRPGIDPGIAPNAARTIHELAGAGLRLVLTSVHDRDLAPALRAAGIGELFHMIVQPRTVGAGKPSPLVYSRIITAADCVPGRVLSVGPGITNDVTAPQLHGLRGVLLPRFDIAYPPLIEDLPQIRDLSVLPRYLGRQATGRSDAGGQP
ncbi:HAD family hydrolase [Actinomadura violacea]|uniref:HAD hydrolase-like protein n=1 Tax=Actinomadura violacea TaxID=2819934 RepID=A0ABS3RXP6_9ACTN|nr:HAD family hydrolase [Actinomadura violacea]MBO2461520.1 HAD hydrolase-like protein [Actinomadura violacea]